MVKSNTDNMAANLTKFFEGNPKLFAMVQMVQGKLINEIASEAINKHRPTKLTDEPVTLDRMELDAICACACLGLEFASLIQIL